MSEDSFRTHLKIEVTMIAKKYILSGMVLAIVASIGFATANIAFATSEDPDEIQRQMAALQDSRDKLQLERDDALRTSVVSWDRNDMRGFLDAYAEYREINRAINAIPDQYKELGMKYNDLMGYETLLVKGKVTPTENGKLYKTSGTITYFSDTENKLRCDLQFDSFSIGGDMQDGESDVNFQNNFASTTRVLDFIFCNIEDWESPYSITVSRSTLFAQCTDDSDTAGRTSSFNIDCSPITFNSDNIIIVTVQADYDIDTISVSDIFTMS